MRAFILVVISQLFIISSIYAECITRTVVIDDITIDLPSEIALDAELSKPDEGAFCYQTPSNDFMFIFMYFAYDGSYSARDRLIGEAEQMGIELTGDGDIATMSLGNDKMIEFTATPNIGIGVSFFYPEEQVGLFFCIITPDPDINRIFDTLASIRAK